MSVKGIGSKDPQIIQILRREWEAKVEAEQENQKAKNPGKALTKEDARNIWHTVTLPDKQNPNHYTIHQYNGNEYRQFEWNDINKDGKAQNDDGSLQDGEVKTKVMTDVYTTDTRTDSKGNIIRDTRYPENYTGENNIEGHELASGASVIYNGATLEFKDLPEDAFINGVSQGEPDTGKTYISNKGGETRIDGMDPIDWRESVSERKIKNDDREIAEKKAEAEKLGVKGFDNKKHPGVTEAISYPDGALYINKGNKAFPPSREEIKKDTKNFAGIDLKGYEVLSVDETPDGANIIKMKNKESGKVGHIEVNDKNNNGKIEKDEAIELTETQAKERLNPKGTEDSTEPKSPKRLRDPESQPAAPNPPEQDSRPHNKLMAENPEGGGFLDSIGKLFDKVGKFFSKLFGGQSE